jgi:hypothetical protein
VGSKSKCVVNFPTFSRVRVVFVTFCCARFAPFPDEIRKFCCCWMGRTFVCLFSLSVSCLAVCLCSIVHFFDNNLVLCCSFAMERISLAFFLRFGSCIRVANDYSFISMC